MSAAVLYGSLPADQRVWFDSLFDDLLIGSHYWLRAAGRRDGVWYLVTAETGEPYEVTPDRVLAALREYALWFIDHSDEYFARFGLRARRMDFAGMDYDARVTDCLLQLILFDDVIYG